MKHLTKGHHNQREASQTSGPILRPAGMDNLPSSLPNGLPGESDNPTQHTRHGSASVCTGYGCDPKASLHQGGRPRLKEKQTTNHREKNDFYEKKKGKK